MNEQQSIIIYLQKFSYPALMPQTVEFQAIDSVDR